MGTATKLLFLVFFYCVFYLPVKAEISEDGLLLHYSFSGVNGDIVPDNSGNGNNGTLKNQAEISNVKDINILNLGTSNGYLDMGVNTGNLIATLENFTISTYLYIDESSNITGNGNFVWTFSSHAACSGNSGKYIAYRVNRQRYALSTGGWGNEVVAVEKGSASTKGIWQHILYMQSGTVGTIYIDGEIYARGTTALQPKDIGVTTYNWLGRPHFNGDSYLQRASYADFRIYNRALTDTEILDFQPKLAILNYAIDENHVEDAKKELIIDGLDAVRNNLTLPAVAGNNVNVLWSSSNKAVLADDGTVVRPAVGQASVKLTLTARLSKGNYSAAKEFAVTVLPKLREQDAVKQDAEGIDMDISRCYFLGNIQLPKEGLEGSSIKWKSDAPEYITNSGEIKKLPASGNGNKNVVLTAEISSGSFSETRDFSICLNEDEGFSGYLFAYFTGSNEDIFFALSNDGYTYKALNSGSPIIRGHAISDKGGVRDPHVLRGHDGKYYMVVTDMQASQGWDSNHGIVLLRSDDLLNWTHSKIDIKNTYPSKFGTITRAWAPQTFYDEKTGKYMVYFSTKRPNEPDIIHYAYANEDFTAFESVPEVLFDHPQNKSCIDGDIIYKDGKYHLFFKTEGDGNGIKKAVSENLTGKYVIQDHYLQQTNLAVEGSCVFRLINQDKYILMYDVYMNGKYEFTESSDLENFSLVNLPVSMDFAPRHGTVIPITNEEATCLSEKWGTTSLVAFGTALSPDVKTINAVINENNKTVFLPVRYGADLSTLDPQIAAAIPGIKVSPEGAQDFSSGAVEYTLSLKGTSKTYNVTAAINNNPVLEGYFADPEILYSEKTGKFYIYPTSDGFADWGGYYFKVFSSDDLVNWTDEGIIIDMHTDQVRWANGNAWAPCIIEKKINGVYKYFYYFSGGQDGGAKKIGVAVANDPAGPFTVSREPLINSSPVGSGQQIDPDVFTDPKTGKSYIYWGNGYLAAAELNDDMISINESTIKVMTPNSTFTEAVYVFYRNDKYYFLWSQGNTNNKDYKVWYATSDSPMGTLSIPSNNNILKLDESQVIYGPGHNSVIQIPGKDEWYIVYHRISRPNGISMSKPGNFREVCIDKLEFNVDGSIKHIMPTLKGIDPVSLSDTGIDLNIEDNEEAILVYPGLVNDVINIQLEDTDTKGLVSVIDISGRLMIQQNLYENITSLNCSALHKGYYLVIVKTGNKISIKKIIKI